MLEFNQEHKVVDLSSIKSKIQKSKNIGKVMLCGTMLSAVLLLSGCGAQNTNANTNTNTNNTIIATAIIVENGNALLINTNGNVLEMSDNFLQLNVLDGGAILVDVFSTKIIKGVDSYEKAYAYAQTLIDEDGQILDYEDLVSKGKTR